MGQCGPFLQAKLTLLRAQAEGVGLLSAMHDFALWTAVFEINGSQPRVWLVTCDVVWYKKINWATGTCCLGNEN